MGQEMALLAFVERSSKSLNVPSMFIDCVYVSRNCLHVSLYLSCLIFFVIHVFPFVKMFQVSQVNNIREPFFVNDAFHLITYPTY